MDGEKHAVAELDIAGVKEEKNSNDIFLRRNVRSRLSLQTGANGWKLQSKIKKLNDPAMREILWWNLKNLVSMIQLILTGFVNFATIGMRVENL